MVLDEFLLEISMGVSIQPPTAPSPPEVSPLLARTKGSSHTIEESGNGGVDIFVGCELCVDDPPQHLVALGKFYSNYNFWFIFVYSRIFMWS